VQLVISLALPVLPLVLTEIPMNELLKHLVKIVL
jgi:hypothetical protein